MQIGVQNGGRGWKVQTDWVSESREASQSEMAVYGPAVSERKVRFKSARVQYERQTKEMSVKTQMGVLCEARRIVTGSLGFQTAQQRVQKTRMLQNVRGNFVGEPGRYARTCPQYGVQNIHVMRKRCHERVEAQREKSME